MFGIGLPELIIIIVVALLVVGPSKLPELARSMGRALGEFRRMADDVKETIEQEMTKPLDIEDERKVGQEERPEAATEWQMAEAQGAGDQAAVEAAEQEGAQNVALDAQQVEPAEPSPDETFLAEEEKRLLDEKRQQTAKGTEVDEQQRT